MSDKEGKKPDLKEFFRFTKDGKMKSGTLAYSITYAALYLVVYGACYYFLIDVLGPLTAPLPILVSDIIGAVVPGLIGAILLLIPLKFVSDKKPAFLAYVWLAVFALIFCIAMVIQLKDDPEALQIFLRLFFIMVPVPLILGGGSTWYLWKKDRME